MKTLALQTSLVAYKTTPTAPGSSAAQRTDRNLPKILAAKLGPEPAAKMLTNLTRLKKN